MRKWGILISVFYALIVLFLLLPVAIVLSGKGSSPSAVLQEMGEAAGSWFIWLIVVMILGGQALLLFLSVDASQKRLKPHAHILVSVTISAMLLGLLATAVILSAGVAIDEKFLDNHFQSFASLIGFWLALWFAWGIVFYLFARNSSPIVTRAVAWLLTGSVLELLVAVPCHVIVRRRNDCSAPAITSFGIVTGIAVMLLSFGPGVLMLYKKRLDSYGAHKPGTARITGA